MTLLASSPTALHEAAHASAMMSGNPPMIPTLVRVDHPRLSEGSTDISWGADGITRSKAKVVLVAIIVGAFTTTNELGDATPSWAIWPLDPDRFPSEIRRDVEQIGLLCAYLKVDHLGWLRVLLEVERMWARRDFRRLLVRITEALERSETLDKQDLIDLLEAERCSI